MNHKWKKIKKDEYECEICTCTRYINYYKVDGKWRMYYSYSRSGIYTMERRPDCIDWEEENKKTID